MSELRFDDRVAIVTGAGGGLGREHALLLAARGAKVVVNDLGGATDGSGDGATSAADLVVEEIKAAGGEAVANYDSVTDGEKIVKTAIDAWGRVDIVVNNAGILRDKSFAKMSERDWDLVLQVHLEGAQRVTRAAWPYMVENQYGRVIMTASGAGIYGNFGQANYSAAKLGLHGFAQSLAVEGQKKNIHVNTIAPIAKSRLTIGILPEPYIEELKPEYVSPLVAWLCHENCPQTKGLFEVGAGYMAQVRWERNKGNCFPTGKGITPDMVANRWDKITDFSGENEHPADVTTAIGTILNNITNPSQGGNEFIDVDLAMSAELVMENSYDERDLSIYALGVGAAKDPLDPTGLAQVYEGSRDGFKALHTYAAIPYMNAMLEGVRNGDEMMPGLNYGFDRVLHGEQFTEIKQVLKPNAKLKHTFKVKAVYDKDPHAVVVMGITTTDENGVEIAYNENSTFVRGGGGWGGDRGPSSKGEELPSRQPDAVIEENIPMNQTLLYRLSGDWNPLHADPSFATAFGFDKPILHGMCTHGFVGRHVVEAFADNDPRYLKSFKVRFAESVFPGETLETKLWKEGNKITFETKVKERNLVVLSNASAELFEELPEDIVVADDTQDSDAGDKVSTTDIFAAISTHIAENPHLADVGTSFQFKVSNPNSEWYLSLKDGKAECAEGALENADVILEISENDLIGIVSGEADAQKLYFSGKLGVSGDVMASNNLTPALEGLTMDKVEEAKNK